MARVMVVVGPAAAMQRRQGVLPKWKNGKQGFPPALTAVGKAKNIQE